MVDLQATEKCMDWIKSKQTEQESEEFGYSRPEVEVSLNIQKLAFREIGDYEFHVDKHKYALEDNKLKENLEKAYSGLKETGDYRLGCLEDNLRVTSLDSNFSPLTNSIHSTSVKLVTNGTSKFASKLSGNSSINSIQQCMKAARTAWDYVDKQMKCSEIQLQHTRDYYLYYHDLRAYELWMPAELSTVTDVTRRINKREDDNNVEDPLALLEELKGILAMYLAWKDRMNETYDRSNKIIPVYLRTKRQTTEKKITVLCNYKTDQIQVKEGEEMMLLDNSKPDMWRVKNYDEHVGLIPSHQIVICGPDQNAIEDGLKLRFQFYDTWVSAVRRLGKALISYFSTFFKDWTHEEELQLMALSTADKQKLRYFMDTIQSVFSPYWDVYAPYKCLLSKMERLRKILDSNPPKGYKDNGTPLPDLLLKVLTLEDMALTYKEFWDAWQRFRSLKDANYRPESTQGQVDFDDYRLFDSADALRKWQSDIEQEGEDATDGLIIEDEVYMLETAKETAETSQISTSEQEERQTFIITGIEDPQTGEIISLDEAIQIGIINQMNGTYYNASTRESIPIPAAMTMGKIKVEFTKTKKSAEKKSDLGLITIKTYGEPRPFTIKGVVDPKTEKILSVDEAIKRGILDQRRGIYRNSVTNQELSMCDALDSRLLIVEFENSGELQNGFSDNSVITKTYAIHAVIDTRNNKRLTFAEATHLGFIDQETGAYFNKKTGEKIYVGDAIKQGWIKASVVNDPRALDIAPGQTINLPGEPSEVESTKSEQTNGPTLVNGHMNGHVDHEFV